MYLSKQDMKKVVYVECGEALLIFFALFLFFLSSIYARSLVAMMTVLGCIGNLFRSFKGLSCSEITIPRYYSCTKNLLGITVQNPPSFYRCISCSEDMGNQEDRLKHVNAIDPKTEMRVRKIKKELLSDSEKIVKLSPMDPKGYGGFGFVKGETNFIVSDDLFITPLNSSSRISLLSKLQMNINDIDEHVINISKSEAVSLLRL